MMDTKQLMATLKELAPWHFNIDLGNGLRTIDANPVNAQTGVSVVETTQFEKLMQKVFPQGLSGKRFLDVACNSGGYSLCAHRLGAEYTYGFDVRQHWIAQANFLRDYFNIPKGRMTFRILDLLKIESRKLKPFHISIFKGIFYHLPYPVYALRKITDLTTELIWLDTESFADSEDNHLRLRMEGTQHPMSGVHELSWWPTGTDVLKKVLAWAGFPHSRVLPGSDPVKRKDGLWKRLSILASRSEKTFESYDGA